jgi:uncharacterized protein YwgA
MALRMTGTAEHALVARVVRVAADAAEHNNSYVGRTSIQKIIYFLKARGVPVRYRYSINHYGPFAEDLQVDMEWLIADNVVVDASRNPSGYSKYVPGNNNDELIAKYDAIFRPYDSIINEIVAALVPMSPDQLELLATLDYAYREVKARAGTGPCRQPTIDRFREIKHDKFNPEVVGKTYDVMVSAGLFAA